MTTQKTRTMAMRALDSGNKVVVKESDGILGKKRQRVFRKINGEIHETRIWSDGYCQRKKRPHPRHMFDAIDKFGDWHSQ